MGLVKFFGLDNIEVIHWKSPIELPVLKSRDDMVRILMQYENGSYTTDTFIGNIPLTYHNWFKYYVSGSKVTGNMTKWAYLD